MHTIFDAKPDMRTLLSIVAAIVDSAPANRSDTLTSVIDGLSQIRTSYGFKTNIGDFVRLDYESDSFMVGIFADAKTARTNDSVISVTCIASSLSDEHLMISDIRAALSLDVRDSMIDVMGIAPTGGLRNVLFQLTIKLPNGETK